ncbi:hypothetical protein WAH70_02565 [Acinetobacter baumannii]|uniref:hypothetical protein n=1 Tax=Acinetobacter calcoaceticus/baumannii complex TaxID=909768 RepID=UPI000A3B29F0|nr:MULTISPECIES: hypothetical protein [Acinetobacter calcoaceticus/baumannii complex]MCU4645031.1 hypothetical protein [Acinetobacter pittii]OTU30342.1 hypothetical protein CAT60_02520 [Acinetobacter pittii]
MTDFAKLFSEIFLSLIDRRVRHDQITGLLHLNNDSLSVLKQLAENELTDGSVDCIFDGDNIGGVALEDIGQEHFQENIQCEITLHTSDLSKNLDYAICNNWPDLLNSEYTIKKPVKSVFFIESGIYVNENSGNLRFNNYLKLNQIYDLIGFLSESTNSWNNTIFYQRPIKFVFSLSEKDLDYSIDTTALENLRKRDLHQEAIINLMCKEVVSFVKNIDEKQRVSYLVQNFNALISNILLSYQTYTENYSFDKVRKEYLEKRTEYVKKMNEAFDSVAVKMLAIPAAIWFAIAQIKPINSSSPLTDFSKNYIVLITVSVIVAILVLNIWGHRNSLVTMVKEYQDIFKNLSSKFEDETIKILSIKEELDRNAFSVILKMYFSIFSAIVLLMITLFLFVQSNYGVSLEQILN